MIDDEHLLQQFEDCTLPKSQWTHTAHVKVAYLYLQRYRVEDAIDKMRLGIKALNAAHGTRDTLTGGYHETMTQAWVRLIASLLMELDPAGSAEAFFQSQPQLWQTTALRQFYSQELLMSPDARTRFVEPDLAPLPRSRRTGGR